VRALGTSGLPTAGEPNVKTFAVTIAALMLGAAPGAFAQPPSGSGDQGYQPSGQGYQGYPNYQGQSQTYQGPSQPYQGQSQPYQGQMNGGQGYNGGQSYQGQGVGPPPSGYGGPDQSQMQQQYGQSDDDYQAQMRQYRREKREYERQRGAYEAQFGGAGGGGYGPPPPQPPAPPASWQGADARFYRYSETMPFREGPWMGEAHDTDWYRDHGCRLATPRQGWDAGSGRSIVVCPDDDGRYRPVA
jgi:hypothetical protein